MKNRNKERYLELPTLSILILLSFLIRYLSTPWRPTFPDSFTYLKLSQSIQEGKYYLEIWARGEMVVKPLYSILANIFAWPSNNIEFGATWVSLVSGGLLLIPLFFLAKWIAGRKVAWLSVIIAIFNPELIRYSTYILTESMYTLILLLPLAVGFWVMRERMPDYFWILLGIIVGISLMSRDVAMIGLPLFLFWITLNAIISGEGRKKAVVCIALFLAGIILFKGSYMILHTGKDIKPRPTSGMIVKKLTTPDLRNFAERERYLSMLTPDGKDYIYNQYGKAVDKGVIHVIWKNKWSIVGKLGINLFGHIKVLWKSFPTVLIILLIIGLIRNLVYGKDILTGFYLISWVVVYISFYAIAGAYTSGVGPMATQRYLVPIFPVIFIWVGMGITWVSDLTVAIVKNRLQYPTAIKYLTMAVLTAFIIATYTHEVKANLRIRGGPKDIKSPSQVVGNAIGKKYPGSLIMTRLPTIPYYARASWLFIPDEPIDMIINFARYKDVDFIILDSEYTLKTRPQLASLLKQGIRVEGLKLVYGLRHPREKDQLFMAVYGVM